MGENRIHTGTATVVKNTGSHYLLSELPQWKPLNAVVRGKLRLSGSTATNPVAVGDRVEYSVPVDADGNPVDEGTITKVLPRKNYIIRKSTNLSRQCHILASNIDTAYLIVTLDCPELQAKSGLFHSIYTDAGYPIMDISVLTGQGVDTLREQCNRGGISLFSGVSGVGKSSLIKAIYKPCTHTHEPGCAVLEAVENGTVSPERYMSYLGMLEEEGKYR